MEQLRPGGGEPSLAGQDEADRARAGAATNRLPGGAHGQVVVAAHGVDAAMGQRRPEAVAGLRAILGELPQPDRPAEARGVADVHHPGVAHLADVLPGAPTANESMASEELKSPTARA